MGCTSCGNTHSSPCSCQDHGLTFPCSYTDCSSGHAEKCEDVQRAECVAWTGDKFCVENSNGDTFCINEGERLDFSLHNLALFLVNPTCWDLAIKHVWIEAVTNQSIEVYWSGVSASVVDVNVYYSVPGSNTWILANTTPLLPTVTSLVINNLPPSSPYIVKVEAAGASSTCDSVHIYTSTIA